MEDGVRVLVSSRSGQQDDDDDEQLSLSVSICVWSAGLVCSGWAKEAEPVPRFKKLNPAIPGRSQEPCLFLALSFSAARSPSSSENQDGAKPKTDASLELVRSKNCAIPHTEPKQGTLVESRQAPAAQEPPCSFCSALSL